MTGTPRGYISDTVANFNIVTGKATPEDLVFSGRRNPSIFGSIRNAFIWKQFSLSLNIRYKFSYHFRRNSVDYTSLYNFFTGHSDYAFRWTKPGDETVTNVPVLPTTNTNYNNLYNLSNILVEKGDHIRLQDFRIAYDFERKVISKLSVQKAQLYVYANNIGILWRANKQNLDPDYGDSSIPPGRSIAVGINVHF